MKIETGRRERRCRGTEKRLAPLMFVGTGSDVGKSVIATGFCRVFKQDGYHPAPFKAQNMSLNSAATPDGLEIGRAQAVQAEAAGVPSSTDMNPLLLKPNSDHTSQIVLNGRPAGNQSAYEYFRKEGREELRKEVNTAFDRLNAEYNPIIMEGAGSVSEINLREVDIVNMPMAIHAGARVILVADIERGGLFASVYGSVMLMTPQERAHIKGIIINKFRGDIRLFEEGRRMIENLCGIPVLGVIPYFSDIQIEEEDSVSLEGKKRSAGNDEGVVKIAVVLLRHISNFTDFDTLERDNRVRLFYSNNTEEIEKADIVIIPGSKSTLDDLYELRKSGVASAIITAYSRGATVLGICGGYQIMGMEVCDPEYIEGDIESLPGLGLLPASTVIGGEKRTRQVLFKSELTSKWSSKALRGYEIHMGLTSINNESSVVALPLNLLEDGSSEGCFVNERCMGTYLHGFLDNADIIEALLLPHSKVFNHKVVDYETFKEEQYDKLAALIRANVDLEAIYSFLV